MHQQNSTVKVLVSVLTFSSSSLASALALHALHNPAKTDDEAHPGAPTLHGNIQQPIGMGTLPQRTKGSVSLPLTSNFSHELGYFTEIALGNPPQQFRVLLDISAADSFIASVECDSCWTTDADFIGYNSSLSSSFHHAGAWAEVDYGLLNTGGNISQDTLTLGDVQIHGQLFQEAMKIGGGGSTWDDKSIINGLLGLTPSSRASVYNASNPFLTAVSQDLLESNMFALRLVDPGELTIGGTNRSLYTGDITRVPATNENSSFLLTGRWQTPAKSLSVGPCHDIQWSLEGYTAAFSTLWTFIYLPDRVALDLNKVLQFEECMFVPPSVECHLRDTMPDVVLNLAGTDLTLSPYDYAMEWDFGTGHIRCISMFTESELPDKEIVLGSAFLRNFYTVFDLDSQTIGFAKLA